MLQSSAVLTSVSDSPQDGSLWMAGGEQGIFRVGRNGRRIHYDNKAVSLSFDADGVLWLLDDKGRISTYSSLTGFVDYSGLDSEVSCILVSGDKVYAATSSGDIYSLSLKGPAALISSPGCRINQMIESSDGSIWLVGQSGACLMTAEGELHSWVKDAPANVSNLIPFEFETSGEIAPVERSEAHSSSSNVLLWCLLAGISSFIIAWLLASLTRRKGRDVHIYNNTEVAPEIDPVLAKVIKSHEGTITPAPEHAPVDSDIVAVTEPQIEFEPVSEPIVEPVEESYEEPVGAPESPVKPEIPGNTPFTETVMALIEENISNPSYGVDDIANDLGISRIHLNRKLKAESCPSPSALLKKARMDMASSMIKDGTYSIAEIATRCGFATPSYFSTAFKQYFGKTPSEYI